MARPKPSVADVRAALLYPHSRDELGIVLTQSEAARLLSDHDAFGAWYEKWRPGRDRPVRLSKIKSRSRATAAQRISAAVTAMVLIVAIAVAVGYALHGIQHGWRIEIPGIGGPPLPQLVTPSPTPSPSGPSA